jgi:hypothetical protein
MERAAPLTGRRARLRSRNHGSVTGADGNSAHTKSGGHAGADVIDGIALTESYASGKGSGLVGAGTAPEG